MSPTPSRHSHSPSPSASNADEVTALLPPTSRPRTPPHGHQVHSRKVSVGQRSIAGSVRGYGAVSTRVSPTEQAPRVSKVGQRVSLCLMRPMWSASHHTARVDDDTAAACLLRAGHIGILKLGVDSTAIYQHRRGSQPQLPAISVSPPLPRLWSYSSC